MGYDLITAPVVEPVTLAEARDHLRATSNAEDWLIQGWIIAARRRAEALTHRALVTQTWDWYRDAFPAWEMEVPFGRLQSVTSVSYIDAAGATQVLAGAKYLVDAKSDPGRLTPAYGEVWPSTRAQMNAVTVRFVCGYGLADKVPWEIRAAMLLMIGHLFKNREDVADFERFPLPAGAAALLAPYCITRF